MLQRFQRQWLATAQTSAISRLANSARRAALDVYLRVQVALLLWRASSNRQYLAECNPDGLVRSLNVHRFEAEARADEERAHAIRARLATAPRMPRADRVDNGPLMGLALIFSPWLALASALL